MTRVYIANIKKIDFKLEECTEYLSDVKKTKLEALKDEEQQKLSAINDVMLAHYLNRVPNYKIDENGKPYGEEVEFSFAHSGDVSVCAISDSAVGVDVEKIRTVNISIAKRFCEDEYKKIMESADRTDTFFEYWTKKESYLKACGKGIKAGLDSFNVNNVTDFKYTMHNLKNYKICVCSKDDVEFIVL